MKTHPPTPLPHIIEPELRGEMPRHVHNTSRVNAARRLRWNLFPAVLCAAYFLFAHHGGRLAYLQKSGVAALATVTGKSDDPENNTSYTLIYSFVPKPCSATCKVTGSESTTASEYVSTRIGDSLPVTYSPKNPADYERGSVQASLVETALEEDVIWAVLGIGFYLMVLGAFESYYARQRTLLRTGRAVVATVREHPDSNLVRYSFEDPYTGDSIVRELCVSPDRSAKLASGEGFTLLCLPDAACSAEPYFRITTAEIGETSSDFLSVSARQ